MADIFDIIADATRREILQVLLDARSDADGAGEVAVSQIVSALELSQPTVSKHLKVLRESGLVAVREEGQHRYYRLDPAPLEEVDEWLLPFIGADGEHEDELYRQAVASLPEGATSFATTVGKVAAGLGVRVSGAVAKVSPKKG